VNIQQAKFEMKRRLLGAVRQVAFEIQEKIVERTPIDTGRAKASWRLNPNAADGSVEPDLTGDGEELLFAGQSLAVARAQQQKIPFGTRRIVISNNLHYIEKLENGGSRQAPVGMVAITVHKGAVNSMFTRAMQDQINPF
jgi:hypothetical protein